MMLIYLLLLTKGLMLQFTKISEVLSLSVKMFMVACSGRGNFPLVCFSALDQEVHFIHQHLGRRQPHHQVRLVHQRLAQVLVLRKVTKKTICGIRDVASRTKRWLQPSRGLDSGEKTRSGELNWKGKQPPRKAETSGRKA